jgi:hypothetical protein
MKPVHATPITDTYVILNDGYPVLKILHERVKQQVVRRILELSRKGYYTSRMLCGEEFWNTLNRGETLLAGHCIASMADTEVLPLKLVKRKHEYPKHYKINK